MMVSVIKPGLFQQLTLVLLAVLATLTAGQAFTWPAAGLWKIKNGEADFSLSDTDVTWTTTTLFIANLISPIPGGLLMDFIGRKRSLTIFINLLFISWACIAGVHSALGLYIARALAGLWAGVMYTIVPLYMGECLEPGMRSVAGSCLSLGLFIGGSYSSVISPFVSYNMLAIYSCIPPTVTMLILLMVPESPYYLVMIGDYAGAKKSLQWLRGGVNVKAELKRIRESVKKQNETRGSIKELLSSPPIRRALVIVTVLGFLQRTSGLTILFSYTSLFLPETFITVQFSVLTLNTSWIISSLIGIFAISLFGRKANYAVSSLGAALTMGIMAVWYYMNDNLGMDMSSTSWLPIVTLLINGLFYSVGIVSMLSIYQSELFPVNVKALASSFTSIVAGLTSVLVSGIFLPLTDLLGVYSNFVISLISGLSGVLFTFLYLIETKGRTLEEIQEILHKRKTVTTRM